MSAYVKSVECICMSSLESLDCRERKSGDRMDDCVFAECFRDLAQGIDSLDLLEGASVGDEEAPDDLLCRVALVCVGEVLGRRTEDWLSKNANVLKRRELWN